MTSKTILCSPLCFHRFISVLFYSKRMHVLFTYTTKMKEILKEVDDIQGSAED